MAIVRRAAFPALLACGLAQAQKLFEGRYTILNKANGRRVVSSSGGFHATVHGAITEEHMWTLVAHENESYVIVNAANGGRILAQSSAAWDEGFFAISQGPVYQDQRWQLIPQDDGSFAIANMKSGRRMWALKEEAHASNFGAVLPAALSQEGDTWWLINQDRDEGARLRSELQAESRGAEALRAQLQERESMVANLSAQLRAAQALQDTLATCGELEGSLQSFSFRVGAVLITAAAGLVSVVALARRLRLHAAHPSSAGEQCPKPLEGQGLGFDFGFRVVDSEVDHETLRHVKVQCPGVEHRDVEVELLFNGCQVTIRRRASCGVEAATWTKRFEFPPQDGLFEFKEDQMRLEHGFLHLVFRAYAFQSRVVRFPKHFTLSSTDGDQWWDYPEGDACGATPEQPAGAPLQAKQAALGPGPCTESTASTSALMS
eukprot:TRINITY_DN32674_c0_g1_i1.p1 TRINITY_DN32674_c0_g1~~TRINITY_DN32674_c0_g1_i1.p1  ORF type:complete len:453 (-),score=119.99 TRINITY_DN32674_c0_g1_i1:114-1412(-)